ncbi:hypothetical protein SO802_017169 [Lithocarpus litseifolius]|uniref:60S acidic ribosomal protein P1 n=1 Tax=Lithocarpus litseifolius TaxID=425828 RepID=A0AAW2D0S9_9ROSI
MDACFTDGIHLSAEGSEIVVEEILKVIKEADWEPCLHWKSMPTEFAEDSTYDLVAADDASKVAVAAAPVAAAASGGAPAAAAAAKDEERKEKPAEESNDDMGFSLFD